MTLIINNACFQQVIDIKYYYFICFIFFDLYKYAEYKTEHIKIQDIDNYFAS